MTATEELELIESAKTNIQAFNKIYEFYFDKIYFFCVQRVLLKETAEDITSQVFLASIKAIQTYDTSKGIKFGSWLYATAHNKIVDYFRSNKKSFFDLDDNLKESIGDDKYDIGHELKLSDMQVKIGEVLKCLNEKYQLVITLRFFSELEIPEIAEVFNQKPQNVSVILHRALESFRKEFVKKYGESEIFDLF